MWAEVSKEYKSLISSADWDSRFLRERGLIPNVLDLVGNCRGKTVLDAGTGTGWLFQHIAPKEAYACDLVRPENLLDHVKFKQDDVHCLSYADKKFDLIVANLLLIYCHDLRRVLQEFNRVSAEGALLVLSIMHPYFYRTGEIMADGRFLLSEDLSSERQFEFRIGGSVGPLTYFYRPFPVYLNSLIETGWRITETRDWFIDMNEYTERRSEGVQSKLLRTGKVPLYTFIKAMMGQNL